MFLFLLCSIRIVYRPRAYKTKVPSKNVSVGLELKAKKVNTTNNETSPYIYNSTDVFSKSSMLNTLSLIIVVIFVLSASVYSIYRLVVFAFQQKETNIFDSTSDGNHDESYLLGKHRN